jgi:PAP2 superfamily protein
VIERVRLMVCAEERGWLGVLAAVTAVELSFWAAEWLYGIAPPPLLGAYMALTSLAAGGAVLVRLALRLKPVGTSAAPALAAWVLIAIGASAFLPLKYAIPRLMPFWLDAPLASGERALFGADPWAILDHLMGWATRPLDWLYGSWLAVQSLSLFLIVLARPSPAKSRVLIAYSLAWLLLGVVAANLFASAGPVFYDRLFGGNFYHGLGETLRARGAWVALAESDAMWASFSTAQPGLASGMSAVPSLHVAISLWLFLAARAMAPRAALPALAYFVLIWVGSIQLGWHYAFDGLAGAAGMIAVWHGAGWLQRRICGAEKRNSRIGE